MIADRRWMKNLCHGCVSRADVGTRIGFSHCRDGSGTNRRTRLGFTVVEVTIAAVVLSVLTVTGITVVLLLMTAEQRAAESLVVERSIAALADELRRDAHAATTAELTGEEAASPTTLSLWFADDSQATYECTDDGVWRREQRGDMVARREKFHLPFGTSWFEPLDGGTLDGGRLVVWRHEREIPVTMSLAEPSATSDQPRRAFRIEAALWRSRTDGARPQAELSTLGKLTAK